MAHPTKLTPERKAKFVDALVEFGLVTRAAEIAGISRWSAYQHRAKDSDFAAAWDDAREQFCEALEDEARRRAMDGIEEPVYYQGRQVGTQRVYSDKLLALLLRAARPSKYGRRIETGNVAQQSGGLTISISGSNQNDH
jgi:hypothetical protein